MATKVNLTPDNVQALLTSWGECMIALETLHNSDSSKPIPQIGPALRLQILTAVLSCRRVAHLIAVPSPNAPSIKNPSAN
jgi:hypothetical protein